MRGSKRLGATGGRTGSLEAEAEPLNLAKGVIDNLRAAIIKRAGSDSIAAIGLRFRLMDREVKDGLLSATEMMVGLKQVGIQLSVMDAEVVLKALDKDGSGQVCFDEFIFALRGVPNTRRKGLIDQAFQILDPNGDGSVSHEEMMTIYDVSAMPEVQEGKLTPKEAMTRFMSLFDHDADNKITLKEFRTYYAGVSASIDDDDYFELMMRNAWHMSGGEGACENTSNLRVLVTFNTGEVKVVEVENDLGLDKTDKRAIIGRLKRQGITCIDKVSVAD